MRQNRGICCVVVEILLQEGGETFYYGKSDRRNLCWKVFDLNQTDVGVGINLLISAGCSSCSPVLRSGFQTLILSSFSKGINDGQRIKTSYRRQLQTVTQIGSNNK